MKKCEQSGHPTLTGRIETASTFHCKEADYSRQTKEHGRVRHLFHITAWLLKEATLKKKKDSDDPQKSFSHIAWAKANG